MNIFKGIGKTYKIRPQMSGVNSLTVEDFKAFWQGRPKRKPLCSDATAVPKYTDAYRKGELTALLKCSFNADYYIQRVKRFGFDNVGKP